MNLTHYLQINSAQFLTIIGLFGLAIGSFLNVVIYRLPIMLQAQWEDECSEFLGKEAKQRKKFNLAYPSSHCPNCQQGVKAWHNIPVLSYLFLWGKCPHCKTKISPRYPIVELISCAASIIVAANFGVSWQTAACLALTWSLITLTFIDLDHLILPDNITMPLLWLGLLINLSGLFTTIQTAILGAIVGYTSLWLVAWLFKLIRGIEGMGHGDFKLLALFGAWLGWVNLPFIIFAASVLGLIVGIIYLTSKKLSLKNPIPFGPYIAIAGWIALLWGNEIFHWYLSFIGRM